MKYRAQRYPTRFPVKVMIGGSGKQAEINSISGSGARICVDEFLAVGATVTLVYSGGRISGVVQWSTPTLCGIKFGRPLAKSELDRIRYGLRSAMGQRSHRIGFSEMR